MEFENDLGLDLLMNNKKKISSDAISLSSRSSIPVARSGTHSPVAESIEVIEHLQPPSPRGQASYGASPADSYVDSDEDDVDYASESEEGYAPQYGGPRAGAQGTYQQQRFSAPQQPSEEDILNEKKELLYQFERMERKGVRLPRKFTLASNLEEMRMEFDRIKRDRELDNSIKFQKRMTITAVSGLEFLSDKFSSLGLHLNGWSNSVNDELDEYEDVFVELHDKYKGKAKMSPELRLLGGLAGSAFMYHLTHRFSQQLPGLDQVLKQNPELAAKLAEATRSQMAGQQQAQGSFFSNLGGGLGGLFGNMFGGGGQAPPPQMPQDMAPGPSPKQASKVRMKGPTAVEDILGELNKPEDRVELMSSIASSEIGDLPDDVSSINGLFVKKNGARSIDLEL